MPYIPEADRAYIDEYVAALSERLASGSVGQLNYAITTLIDNYLGEEPNYHAYNSILGVLEAAKLELYRRRISRYEDDKLAQNGDVYSGPHRVSK